MRRVSETTLVIDLFSYIYSQQFYKVKSRKSGGYCLRISLQGSRSTFSGTRFPSFFAFKEGIWETHIAALLSSPTVSGGFVRLVYSSKKPLGEGTPAYGCRQSTSV